jgi:predicted nucleotide-binding protein
MATCFVVQPPGNQYRAVYELIVVAASAAGVIVSRLDSVSFATDVLTEVQEAILKADFLIVDVSEAHPNVMFELGIARSRNTPTIFIANSTTNIPFDLARFRVLIYDITSPADLVTRLTAVFVQAAKAPQDFSWTKAIAESQKRQSVFISYSHSDRLFLDRLLLHLKPLEREGLIEVWVDTRLRAGDKWRQEIEEALNHATVALLLVSADFLASDFITNNELPPILRKAEEKGTKVIPLILKPCRFTRDGNLRHFQSINVPEKSLILLPEGEQELLYDRVAAEVERHLQKD